MRIVARRLLVLSLLLLAAGPLAAQSDFAAYHLRCHKASRLIDANRPDSALMLYREAFHLVDTPRAAELHAAWAAFLQLKKQQPLEAPEWEFQAAVYERCAVEAETATDGGYAAFIHRLSREDQRVRGRKFTRAAEALERCKTDPACRLESSAMRKATARMVTARRTDSVNIGQLLQKIGTAGFSSARRVGAEAAAEAFVILLHFDRDSLNAALDPLLQTALKAGDLDPEQYAWIVDRRLNWCQGKDPYYYQLPVGDALNDPAQLEAINQRRAAIGLPEIAESFSISKQGGKTVITIQ